MKIPSKQNNFGDKVLHANADYSVWNEMGSFEVLYHFSLVVDKEDQSGGTVDWTPQIYKSDNLQYNTLGCWVTGTNDSSTKGLMFQL